jgi:hypothetical protein
MYTLIFSQYKKKGQYQFSFQVNFVQNINLFFYWRELFKSCVRLFWVCSWFCLWIVNVFFLFNASVFMHPNNWCFCTEISFYFELWFDNSLLGSQILVCLYDIFSLYFQSQFRGRPEISADHREKYIQRLQQVQQQGGSLLNVIDGDLKATNVFTVVTLMLSIVTKMAIKAEGSLANYIWRFSG